MGRPLPRLAKSNRFTESSPEPVSLACGTWRSTPIAPMQVECGEMPLQCRRLAQQIRFAVKVKATEGHVAQSVFREHWTTVYGNYDDRNCPMAVKVDKYFQQRGDSDKVAAPEWARVPPWTVRLPLVDTDLTREPSKHEQPFALATLARDKISMYGDRVHIYTDASKGRGGRVGIGC